MELVAAVLMMLPEGSAAEIPEGVRPECEMLLSHAKGLPVIPQVGRWGYGGVDSMRREFRLTLGCPPAGKAFDLPSKETCRARCLCAGGISDFYWDKGNPVESAKWRKSVEWWASAAIAADQSHDQNYRRLQLQYLKDQIGPVRFFHSEWPAWFDLN